MKPENWHRHHAIQTVAALPGDPEDALIVLDLARMLVESFLSEPQAEPTKAPVVTLVRPRPDLSA
jgi:hypothetical protein